MLNLFAEEKISPCKTWRDFLKPFRVRETRPALTWLLGHPASGRVLRVASGLGWNPLTGARAGDGGRDPDRDSFFLFLSRTKTFPVMTPCANPPRQKCRPFLSASGLLRGMTRESFGRVRRRSREPGQEREQPEAAGGGPAGPGLLGGPGRGRHRSQPCSLHLLPPRRRNQGCRRGQRPRGTTRPRAGPPPPEGPRLQVVRLSHWKPDQGRTPSTQTRGIVTRLL